LIHLPYCRAGWCAASWPVSLELLANYVSIVCDEKFFLLQIKHGIKWQTTRRFYYVCFSLLRSSY